MAKKLIFFSIAIGVLEACLLFILGYPFHYLYVVYLLYFFGITYFMNWSLQKKVAGKPQKFVTAFMGFMSIKLFLSLILLLATLWFNREHKISLAMFFLLDYLLFTTYSVVHLFGRLKKSNPDGKE